ncbi:hypothetical protein MMC16_006239 [Acarospora aff. strigata]|nr:hypothetical protein [Acarospora aff. strigata]
MQLQYLVQKSHLNLPTISRKEIWDKSKANKFAKTLAILQTTWLATEVIARAVQDLPITLLELFSLALSITSLSTQWFWLNKPLDVAFPTILTLKTSVADILVQAGDAAKKPFRTTPLDFIEPDIYQSCSWSGTVLRWILRRGLQARPILRRVLPFQSLLFKLSCPRLKPASDPSPGLPNDRDWQPTTFAQNMSLAIPVVIFATIHLGGWNFSFASRPELLIWRINVIVIWGELAVYGASEVILFWKSGYTKMSLELANGYKKTSPTSLLFHIPAFIYFCGRLLLIVEVVVSLRSLPERAFVRTQWTDFFPHL